MAAILFLIGLFFLACMAIGTVLGVLLGILEVVGTIKGYDIDEEDADNAPQTIAETVRDKPKSDAMW